MNNNSVLAILAASLLDRIHALGAGEGFQLAVFLSALGLVTLLASLLVVALRKRHRHRRHNRHRRYPEQVMNRGEDAETGERKRRRRKKHRPRNPTRAETGGMPARREGPPPHIP